MDEQRRRTLLRAAAAAVAVPLAGCFDDSGTGRERSRGEPEPEGNTDEQSGDDDDGSGAGSVAAGEPPYARWIPAPETGPDDAVDSLAFSYINVSRLRLLEYVLTDAAAREIPRANTLPLIQRRTVDEYISLQTPIRKPDTDFTSQIIITTGTFDRDEVLAEYRLYRASGWDEETDYGGFTLLTTGPTDIRPGLSIGVSESVVLYVPQTIEEEGTQVIEQFVDTGIGDARRVHEADSRIARLFGEVDGSTFVDFSFGTEFLSNGPARNDPPEGLLGTIGGTTVGEQETERKTVFPFTDESRATAARENPDFPPPARSDTGELSESVDGTFYVVTQTLPTTEFEGFSGY